MLVIIAGFFFLISSQLNPASDLGVSNTAEDVEVAADGWTRKERELYGGARWLQGIAHACVLFSLIFFVWGFFVIPRSKLRVAIKEELERQREARGSSP